MYLKFIFIFLTLTFSVISFANEINIEQMQANKAFSILNVLTKNKSINEYLRQTEDIPKSESLEVPVRVFNNIFQNHSQSLGKFILSSEFSSRVINFKKANDLAPTIPDFVSFKTAEENLIKALVLLEFQRAITERPDIQYFGNGTIQNLHYSISNTVEILLVISDNFLKRNKSQSQVADRIRKNFIDKGLNIYRELSPSEKWLNEMNGNQRNYNEVTTIDKAIEVFTSENFRQLIRNMRSHRMSLCAALFA